MKLNTTISNGSNGATEAWLREINEMEHEGQKWQVYPASMVAVTKDHESTTVTWSTESAHVDKSTTATVSTQAQSTAEAEVCEETAPLDSYETRATGLLQDRDNEAFLTRKQAG